MRRFRFVGDPNSGWCMPVEVGRVYDDDYFINGRGDCLISDTYLADWQEITEESSKPLRKDTDLGYFAGLALQALLSNPNSYILEMGMYEIVRYSVDCATELIEALDKEVTKEK